MLMHSSLGFQTQGSQCQIGERITYKFGCLLARELHNEVYGKWQIWIGTLECLHNLARVIFPTLFISLKLNWTNPSSNGHQKHHLSYLLFGNFHCFCTNAILGKTNCKMKHWIKSQIIDLILFELHWEQVSTANVERERERFQWPQLVSKSQKLVLPSRLPLIDTYCIMEEWERAWKWAM